MAPGMVCAQYSLVQLQEGVMEMATAHKRSARHQLVHDGDSIGYTPAVLLYSDCTLPHTRSKPVSSDTLMAIDTEWMFEEMVWLPASLYE